MTATNNTPNSNNNDGIAGPSNNNADNAGIDAAHADDDAEPSNNRNNNNDDNGGPSNNNADDVGAGRIDAADADESDDVIEIDFDSDDGWIPVDDLPDGVYFDTHGSAWEVSSD